MENSDNLKMTRQQLLDSCEVKMVDTSKGGGQQVSLIRALVSIKSKCLDIEIICGYHNSREKNKEYARLMMNRVIEEIVK